MARDTECPTCAKMDTFHYVFFMLGFIGGMLAIGAGAALLISLLVNHLSFH